MDLDHALDLADIEGDISVRVADQHSAWAYPQPLAVLVEQRLQPDAKYAVWASVPREVIADRPALVSVLNVAIDRWLRPWRYPDRCPFPTFDLFPRLSRLLGRCRHRG